MRIKRHFVRSETSADVNPGGRAESRDSQHCRRECGSHPVDNWPDRHSSSDSIGPRAAAIVGECAAHRLLPAAGESCLRADQTKHRLATGSPESRRTTKDARGPSTRFRHYPCDFVRCRTIARTSSELPDGRNERFARLPGSLDSFPKALWRPNSPGSVLPGKRSPGRKTIDPGLE